ncbi:MAG: LysR substrate-binding domain-containing protein [Gammaproteobacteria bacterium]
MNIRDLKYLIALAQHGHFGTAAKRCFDSQPALSMQIKKLEEDLGVQLFERGPKTLSPTDIGQHIIGLAHQVLNLVDEMYKTAESNDPYAGELKVGIFPTLGPYLLPRIIPALKISFPKLKIYLIEEKTPVLVEKLMLGEIHAAFLAEPFKPYEGLSGEFLFQEEFLLAVPSDHPFSQAETVSLPQLQDLPLMLLSEGHCLREQALSVCQHAAATEFQSFQATSLETLRHMVAMGLGSTLMPKLACLPTHNVCYLPFAAPQSTRSILLYGKKESSKHVLLKSIAEEIKRTLA